MNPPPVKIGNEWSFRPPLKLFIEPSGRISNVPKDLTFADAVVTIMSYVDPASYARLINYKEGTFSTTIRLSKDELLAVERSGNHVICGFQPEQGTWDTQVDYHINARAGGVWVPMSVKICGIETKKSTTIEGLCRSYAKSVFSTGLLVILPQTKDNDSKQADTVPKTNHNRGSNHMLDTNGLENDLAKSEGGPYAETLSDGSDKIDIGEAIRAMLLEYNPAALEGFLDKALFFEYTRKIAGSTQVFILERSRSTLRFGFETETGENNLVATYEIDHDETWQPVAFESDYINQDLVNSLQHDLNSIESVAQKIAKDILLFRRRESHQNVEIHCQASKKPFKYKEGGHKDQEKKEMEIPHDTTGQADVKDTHPGLGAPLDML